jgi:hypothetical protein
VQHGREHRPLHRKRESARRQHHKSTTYPRMFARCSKTYVEDEPRSGCTPCVGKAACSMVPTRHVGSLAPASGRKIRRTHQRKNGCSERCSQPFRK